MCPARASNFDSEIKQNIWCFNIWSCHISQFCLCNDNTKTVQSQYPIYKYWPFVQSVGTALTK